jgi:hypothetical protein
MVVLELMSHKVTSASSEITTLMTAQIIAAKPNPTTEHRVCSNVIQNPIVAQEHIPTMQLNSADAQSDKTVMASP